MNYLRGLELIKSQMRAIVLDAMVNPRQSLASRVHWGLDLRSGRMNVYGGLFRFIDVLAVRNPDEGRATALTMLGMLRSYVDEVMPEVRATATDRQPTLVQRSDKFAARA